MRRTLSIVIAVLVLGFIAIQFVPHGREHTNPPVTTEPAWDSATTAALFMHACGDCHSNETKWPWYTNIAPLSWRIQKHVDEGREVLNVSAWGTGEQEAGDAAEQVTSGAMPPGDYLLLHPEASLAETDRQALIDGLIATFGDEGGEGADAEAGDHGVDED